jgi:hypothetical protein
LKQLALRIKNYTKLVTSVLALTFSVFSMPAVAAEPNQQDFDHFQTGFPLTGAHLNAECESCHVGGVLRGTPRVCSGCHATGARVVATPKPSNHFVTNDPCENCHYSTATFIGTRFNHSGALPGQCTSCHNGRISTGKPASHNTGLRLADSCDKCHRTFAWVPATFDHAGITPGTCAAQCHNGTLATARPPSHTSALKATSTCDTCHRYTAWFPTFYNHTSVAPGSCLTCHNGAAATGKPSSHTGAKAFMPCDSCHTPQAWMPARYAHIGVAPGTCLSCHAAQRPTSHAARGYFGTCDACHSIGAQWTFNHALQQGKHLCNNCHSHHHDSTPCDNCHTVGGWGGD